MVIGEQELVTQILASRLVNVGKAGSPDQSKLPFYRREERWMKFKRVEVVWDVIVHQGNLPTKKGCHGNNVRLARRQSKHVTALQRAPVESIVKRHKPAAEGDEGRISIGSLLQVWHSRQFRRTWETRKTTTGDVVTDDALVLELGFVLRRTRHAARQD